MASFSPPYVLPVASGSLVTDPGPADAVRLAALAIVAALLGWHTLRWLLTRRALARRESWAVIPPPDLDITPEQVVAVATGLSAATRRSFLRSANAIRVEHRPNAEGRLVTVFTVPGRAAPALRDALSVWQTLSVTQADDLEWPTAPDPDRSYAHKRTELYVHGSLASTLRPNALDTNPLIPLAAAYSDIDVKRGEDVRVRYDLTPLTPWERASYSRAAIADALRDPDQRRGFWHELINGLRGNTTPRKEPATDKATLEARIAKENERRTLAATRRIIATNEPHFRVVVTVDVIAHNKGLAVSHTARALEALATCQSTAYLRERYVGFTIGGYAVRLISANHPLRRYYFDRRTRTGWAPVPKRGKVVATRELAWIIAPLPDPATHRNVLHTPGYVPAAPFLPTYERGKGLLPLGIVQGPAGRHNAGIPASDETFTYDAGRSRWGKTEHAKSRLLAQILDFQDGALLLDPEGDAIDSLLPYCTGLADRLWIIDMRNTTHQPAWNDYDMTGLSEEDIGRRTGSIVSALKTANGWSDTSTSRALTLATKTTQSLIELAYIACQAHKPELQPTIHQAIPLLTNEAWRESILPALSPDLRSFWEDRFPRMGNEATGPVTQLYDRLASDRALSALLGQPVSTYRIAQAMKEKKVVLICLAGLGDKERTVANLFLHNLFFAAAQRDGKANVFWAHFDEAQAYDDGTEYFAKALERIAKRRVKLHFYNQSPAALTKRTLTALMTNASSVAATATEDNGGALFATNLGGGIKADAIMGQPKYHFVTRVHVGGRPLGPFTTVRQSVESAWGDYRDDDAVPALLATVAENMNYQPVAVTLDQMRDHHAAIARFIATRSTSRGVTTAVPVPAGPPRIGAPLEDDQP